MQHYKHLRRITDCSFFQRQKTTQFSPLYHKFLSLSQGQFFGSWYSSWCSRGVMAEVHKSEKYNMLFPKHKIRNQKLKETLGLSLHFLWQRVQEISAISIALPLHLSWALQLYKSNPSYFPSYSSKSMLLRWWIRKTQFRGGIMSHSDHTRVWEKGSTECWSWHWWQMQQRPVTIGHNLLPYLCLWQTQGIRLRLKM